MNQEFYKENRRKIVAHLTAGEMMLFFSGESVRKTEDLYYPFFTNRNFLYLTGAQQEQSALLLQNQEGIINECLFVLKPDFAREILSGRRFTEQELNEISGIGQIEDISDLDKKLDALLSSQKMNTLWLCFDPRATDRSFDIERELSKRVRDRHPHILIKNSNPLVSAMRKIKTPDEIDAIRRGMQITEAGIRRMMQVAKPGIWEYELEAEFNYELAAHGQRLTAFSPIIAAGERNFFLHYFLPMSLVADGDLILTDVGSTYDEYCTDISRVFPANGHFSERQAQIYQIAYAANRAIMAEIHPGMLFSEPDRICREVTFGGLKKLGLLDNIAEINKYYWHRPTHHIGLDTHDVGGYEEPMAENMVVTVDAGIYVREWGIGLRVEDDVLVTAGGYENLSASIPVTIEEIENIMT